jgi:hypothetical protein
VIPDGRRRTNNDAKYQRYAQSQHYDKAEKQIVGVIIEETNEQASPPRSSIEIRCLDYQRHYSIKLEMCQPFVIIRGSAQHCQRLRTVVQ